MKIGVVIFFELQRSVALTFIANPVLNISKCDFAVVKIGDK